MICGREFNINLKNTYAGKPLLTINSISWTLFPRQKIDMISTSIRKELFERCHWFLMLKNDFESMNFAIFDEVVHNFGKSEDVII